MGRIYAGVLGLLAMITIVLRGLKDGSGAETTMLSASCGLLAFTVIGFAIGELAQWIVDDSVRAKFHAKLLAADDGGRANDEGGQA